MDMENKIRLYISNQPLDRQSILSNIHEIIIDLDKSTKATVEPMMGNEMIMYKTGGYMKYGLAGMKNYMTLHILPIYGSKSLYTKYKLLLNKSTFQKGCINFHDENEMPLEILSKLISECSNIDLKKIREDYLRSKK
jgi:hypothetical protein